jgi:hypothetical protein
MENISGKDSFVEKIFYKNHRELSAARRRSINILDCASNNDELLVC